MSRGHDEQHERHQATTTARRDVARFARAEVVDVLVEGLLALILAGRWPGGGGSGAPPVASATPGGAARIQPQPMENAGV